MPQQSSSANRGGPSFSVRNRLARLVWSGFSTVFFRLSPRPCHGWRSFLLRLWGARIGEGCHIYPRAVIWAPWNLECGRNACIADGAVIYNPQPVMLGEDSVVSQEAYLCGASHDYTQAAFPLISAPIRIGSRSWVAARVIVLMGVSIGNDCVIGAGSIVTKDMPSMAVCAGNPCRVIKRRTDNPAPPQ